MDQEKALLAEATQPCHAGFVIKNFILKNPGLSERRIAELMNTSQSRLAAIIEGKERFTEIDANNLRPYLESAADNLLRVQLIFEFYLKTGRRPSAEERDRLFGEKSH